MSSAVDEDGAGHADSVGDDAAGEGADDLRQADDDESVGRHDAAAERVGHDPLQQPVRDRAVEDHHDADRRRAARSRPTARE